MSQNKTNDLLPLGGCFIKYNITYPRSKWDLFCVVVSDYNSRWIMNLDTATAHYSLNQVGWISEDKIVLSPGSYFPHTYTYHGALKLPTIIWYQREFYEKHLKQICEMMILQCCTDPKDYLIRV